MGHDNAEAVSQIDNCDHAVKGVNTAAHEKEKLSTLTIDPIPPEVQNLNMMPTTIIAGFPGVGKSECSKGTPF
jgi:hypothetical protein